MLKKRMILCDMRRGIRPFDLKFIFKVAFK